MLTLEYIKVFSIFHSFTGFKIFCRMKSMQVDGKYLSCIEKSFLKPRIFSFYGCGFVGFFFSRTRKAMIAAHFEIMQ